MAANSFVACETQSDLKLFSAATLDEEFERTHESNCSSLSDINSADHVSNLMWNSV